MPVPILYIRRISIFVLWILNYFSFFLTADIDPPATPAARNTPATSPPTGISVPE